MFDKKRSVLLFLLVFAVTGTVGAQEPAEAEDEEEEEPLAMGSIVTTGTASKDRTKYNSSVAITTIDDEEIARRAPISTADLLSSIPGFWVEQTSGTTQGNVFARGIIQDGGYRYVALMEDGIPIYPVFELGFYNADQFVRVDSTINRVEAVRGGTAPIFTSGAVGGTVNFVTRSPGLEPEGAVTGTVGDYGMYGVDGYWNGPLTDDWGLGFGGYYRVSDGIRDPGYTADEGGQFRANLVRTFVDGELELFGKYLDDRSLFVVPVPLQGDPSDPDAVNGGDAGEYSLHSDDLAAAGLPASAAEVGLQGSDLEDGIHPQLFTTGARLTWDFTDILRFTNLFRFTDGEVRFDGIFPGPAPVTGAEFAAMRGVAPDYTFISTGGDYAADQLVQNHGHWVVDKEYGAVQNDARLNFLLESHDLTLGFYYADYSMDDRWSLGNLLLMDVSSRPNRLFLPGVTDPAGFTQYSFFNLIADYDAQAYALYASDEWQLTDALRLDFGLRYDTQDTEASISNGMTVDLDGNPATTFDISSLAGPGRTNTDIDFDHMGWSVGFNYELNDTNALFGHYTDSAKLPHFDDIRNGVLIKDEVTNIEFGYKTIFAGLGLFLTAFQTEFDNVPFQDILVDGSIAVRRAETRTRGVEIEGEYQPTDTFNLQFSVTQQDPEYQEFTGSMLDNTGNQIRRIPETMARITPALLFAGERGQVYLTYSYFSERFSNDENTIELPSYNKLDAGVIFDVTDTVSVQLVGDNLTDEVGLTEGNPRTDLGAGGLGALYLARPLFGRSFRASVGVSF
ncbi:MAG: TonB-dependent receptor [Gammaproteobacteria bacterium]|nr:TonB-dependent receptor [Gammaproteobacteria bacterium]